MVKEYVKGGMGDYRYCLKMESYAHSFEDIEKLWLEAKKDFPNLKKDEVEVMHYSSPRYYGIEFTLSVKPPKSYGEAVHLDYIL